MPSLKTRLNSAIGTLKAPFPKGQALITLLERDHRIFEDLIDRIVATGDRAVVARRKLFARLRELLIAHERMEEREFYPALKRFPAAAEIVREGYAEHHVADVIVHELARIDMGSDDWRTKAHVLGENLRHHIGEEERKLFPKAKKLLSEPQLERLAKTMKKDRSASLARGGRAAPKRARTRSR
jgi:hemerythrin superfamily protein